MKTEEYTIRRKHLSALLAPRMMALINSNDRMPTNADGTMPFRQNTDLLWLCGINQEESALLLFPSHPNEAMREILFIRQPQELYLKWHGHSLTADQAAEMSGIKTVKWIHELDAVVHSLMPQCLGIYLNGIEHPRSVNEVETRDQRLTKKLLGKYPLIRTDRLAPLLGILRNSKSPAEIAALKEACRISELGFRRVLRFVKPGRPAKHIEAELIHEYMQHGGNWAGYEPIIASGANTCILHYISNDNMCRAGDLLLLDAAASFQHYNADLTRVIPVSGRYSPRQRQVYKAVLHIQKLLKQFIKAGVLMSDIEGYKNELVISALCELGLCTAAGLNEKGEAYFINRYSYHGFGHFLGLDVHDTGDNYAKLPEHCVLTVEPGIYIWEESTGIRLENNVEVLADGINDLTGHIPVEPEEIEELMNKNES